MLYEARDITKIFIACGYTDLRRGIEGLAQIVEGQYHLDPFEKNVLFLFCGRRKDRIKALMYDGSGYVLSDTCTNAIFRQVPKSAPPAGPESYSGAS